MPDIAKALQLHNWYALAALIVLFATQLFRKAPMLSDLWRKVPDGWRWLFPVVSGASAGFVGAFQAGLSFTVALVGAVGGALGISVPAMGLNALLTESPIRWNGGSGGTPTPPKPGSGLGVATGLVFALALGLLCCGPVACGLKPASVGQVPKDVALAYAGATTALELADVAETAYLDSLASPTAQQLQVAQTIVDALSSARADLVAVHDNFELGRDKLRAALGKLRAVVSSSQTLGLKLPSSAIAALGAAQQALQ
jgi:hypothetical protein